MKLANLALALTGLQGVLVHGSPCNGHSDSRHWKTLAPIPLYPRQEHTTLALNSTTLLILGGIIPAPAPQPPFTTTALLQLYTLPPANKWHPGPPLALPTPLNHPNAAIVNNSKLYLLGGLSDSVGDGVWRGTGESWVYDFEIGAWEELPGMPEGDVPRGSAAVGVDEETGVVYLAGGMSKLAVGGVEVGAQESVDVVSAFDTRRGRWVVGPSGGWGQMPGRRDHAGAAVVGGVMYVLGGRDQGQENVRGEVFALGLGAAGLEEGWVVKQGRMPTPRGGVSAAAVGRKVYVFGGEGNPEAGSEGVFDQVEVYDTGRDRWERVGKMKVPRHGTSAVAVGDAVYIPGGGVKQGGAPVDTFDAFYP